MRQSFLTALCNQDDICIATIFSYMETKHIQSLCLFYFLIAKGRCYGTFRHPATRSDKATVRFPREPVT